MSEQVLYDGPNHTVIANVNPDGSTEGIEVLNRIRMSMTYLHGPTQEAFLAKAAEWKAQPLPPLEEEVQEYLDGVSEVASVPFRFQ